MKSKLTRAISFMLSAVTLTTMFSGCEKKPKEGIAGQATSVSYNTDGTFTTTVTAEEASFSEDLTASDITVSYLRLDEEAYAKAVEKEGEDNIDKINRGDYMVEVKSAVTGVTRKDNKTLEVSFTDERRQKIFRQVISSGSLKRKPALKKKWAQERKSTIRSIRSPLISSRCLYLTRISA